MKFAIISDVHGNYPALSSVIEDAKKNNVDGFIFAGDYIFDMPYPNEVTSLIKNLKNAYVIKGNKEGYLDWLSEEDQSSWDIEQIGNFHQTFVELEQQNLSYLMNLKKSCYIKLPSKKTIYLTHFIKELHTEPKNIVFSSSKFREAMNKNPFTHEYFCNFAETLLNKEDRKNIIESVDADIIILGHSHLQWYAYCGEKLVINPGSCGLPLDCNSNAAYTIMTDNGNSIEIEEKRISYDIKTAIQYSKNTEIYKRSKIWCDLVFSALQTGQDDMAVFLRFATKLAQEKGETGKYISNENWHEAYKIHNK